MPTRRVRRHLAIYRQVWRLAPPTHRARHEADQLALAEDLVRFGGSAWHLWRSVPGDLARVAKLHLRDTVGHLCGGLAALGAAAEVILAAVLTVVLLWVGGTPVVVGFIAAGLVAHGALVGATLRTTPRGPAGRGLTVVETCIAVAALGWTAVASARLVGASDPEYGPVVVSAAVAATACASLIHRLAPPAATAT
ncbi:MAG: hypothetical protein RIE08_12130 [Acidimicrobiales bacterium]